jgi:hypothetical protein
METAVKTRKKPNIERHIGTFSKPKPATDDAYLSKLIEEGINSEDIEFEELLDTLKQYVGGRTPKNMRALYDEDFLSLIEEIQAGKPLSATRKEVLVAIALGNVSDEVVEDFEDAMLVKKIEEAMNDPENAGSVSEAEIMELLRQ